MPLKFSKKSNQKSGRFIVIDGVDGSGKATQTKLLAEALAKEGYEVKITDFPQYGQKSAGLVEEYLNGKYGMVKPYAASVFYAVDRFDASFGIREMIKQGKILISNRYVTANAGHQGGKIENEDERIRFFKWLDNFEYNLMAIPKPDLNIILHVPAKLGQKLVLKKKAAVRKYLENGKQLDLHEADLGHLSRAEKSFLQIAKLFPNTKLIKCTVDGRLLTPQQIHNKVWNLVRRIALSDKNRGRNIFKINAKK